MNPISIAVEGGVILLREGVEAMLIIATLAAFLRRMKLADRVRALYAGAIGAVILSMAAAVLMAQFFNGVHDDRVEAVIMVCAAGLMLYMSGWLFLRQNPARWTANLKQAAEKAAMGPGAAAIAGIAFLAVFREGAETVLFLHALAKTNGGWTIGLFTGLGVAAVLLTVLFVAMQVLAMMLPLRPVFLATSALLFIMGLRFAGAALQELQELEIVSITPAPFSDWLAWAGFNPSLEALGLQAAIAVIAIAGVAIAHTRAQTAPLAAE